MKVKTNVKSGFDLGQEVGRVVNNVADGVKTVADGAVNTAGSLVRDVGRALGDGKFWTWPFGK